MKEWTHFLSGGVWYPKTDSGYAEAEIDSILYRENGEPNVDVKRLEAIVLEYAGKELHPSASRLIDACALWCKHATQEAWNKWQRGAASIYNYPSPMRFG